MFAVIKTGGKQYRVTPGDVIEIEKLATDTGNSVTFSSVLMHGEGSGVTIGTPFVDGAEVVGEVLEQFRGEKVVGLKKRRRKHSSARRWGHRQSLTRVQITAVPGAKATAEELEAAKAPPKKKVKPSPEPEAEDIAADAVEAAEPVTETPAEAPAEPKAEVKTAAPAAPAPEGADDLTKLPGVSAEAAAKLHEQGITSYKQITSFRLADWEKFEEALGSEDFSRTSILTQANKLVETAEARAKES